MFIAPISTSYYLQNNVLSSYKMFTIMNECCMSILCYHNLYNKQHGNTRLENFNMDDRNGIIVTLRQDVHSISDLHHNIHSDYEQFFASYYENMMYKNKHFDKFFHLYKQSFLNSIK